MRGGRPVLPGGTGTGRVLPMAADVPLIRPLRLGPVRLRSNLVLGAMHRHSHRALRLLCRRHGASLAHTEMVTPEAILHDAGRRDELLATPPQDRPLGVQLAPGDAAALAEAVARVAVPGAADLVDLNFGCPGQRTVQAGRGGALLGKPDEAVELVRAAVGASALPVTVKLRLGLADRPADRASALALARGAAEAGAAGITLHARTVGQGYRGRADWAAIGRWADELPVPVIGSGDLRSPEAVLAMLAETGCAGAWIARGALGAPWIFRQVRQLAADGRYAPATLAERRDALLEHFDGLVEEFGEETATVLVRRQAPYYARGLPGAAQVRATLQSARTAGEFRRTVEECFRHE